MRVFTKDPGKTYASRIFHFSTISRNSTH